ncbi:type III secretion chaperone SycN [Nitratidesulfovibrio sp. SRB-5]|uniref:type III secretion chaperone SycN n=1 Tax=Nitratidesulfovibrio sp. SRB-5 TaxID=2872636 RepID=UPI00167E6DEE|nr:type III secretion chaperone SycN [Nitratidesulfovibrio sp. SRB-5]MBZ2170586.1 type III secretion chaperone SycN [Nitratidesulfovibrio sp. SRB-5]
MMLQEAIASFGQRMGMSGLQLPGADPARPDAPRLIALDVDGMGRLHLEATDGELLIYLSRPFPAHDADMPRRMLALCHYRHARPLPLQAGVHAGQAILLTRLPERLATAAAMETATDLLARIMDEATGRNGGA